jgi:tRNA (cytidine/uridine-2'-O-)-methyltransferase
MVPPSERLRGLTPERPFHVVLVEPEIPPNTGNIARLCAATRAALHLVGPLGFSIDEHAVRRAGLDYWHLVDVHRHADLGSAERALRSEPGGAGSRSWLFSGKASRSYLDVEFRLGDALVFGRESVGLPAAMLAERADHVIGIPMPGLVRSLNLSNAVSIALYEALRQTGVLATTATTC